MQKSISLVSILTSLLFMALTGSVLSYASGINAGFIISGLFLASFIPMPQGILPMAVQKEIWINHLVGNIFKNNPHLAYAFNADAYVLDGKVVHIPQAGGKPVVKRNRTTLPASVTLRADTDITYVMDEFTSDPMRLKNADKYELSYDMRQSIVGEQSSAIDEMVGDWFYRYWAPSGAAQIARTTGSAAVAHTSGATGNRKKVTVADIKEMRKRFNKQGISRENRVCSLDADMYEQFTDELTATQYRDFSKALDEKTGVVGKLFGFTFLEPRETVLVYNNDSTPAVYDPGENNVATDNAAALFWQKDMVIRSLGEKELFDDEGNPIYYGDIYSALVRAGGRIKREDGKGVFALVQAATA